ncbi:hypothetical protein K1719_040896 [Acacia pycnantha]|nr:hypothetical protein K1719_040896 [Acacia pycnantha]
MLDCTKLFEYDLCMSRIFRTGTVNRASGSAYAEFGNTKVIASVNIGRLNCNVSHATFATLDREQGSNPQEYSMMLYKALEGAIILESFPKTTVDVFALVLESGGNAGIMTYDLVSSASVEPCHCLIDPNLEEENCQDGSLMISCMPSRCEVTQLSVTGDWSTLTLDEGMQLCLDACAELAKIMRSCLRDVASASQE